MSTDKTLALLAPLTRFINAVLDETATERERGTAARQCLVALLEAVETLLKSVKSELTVRQLLRDIVRNVPVKDYLREPLDDFVQRIKTDNTLKLQHPYSTYQYDVLATDCGSIGDEVGTARFRVKGALGLTRIPTYKVPPLPEGRDTGSKENGPVEDEIFVWQGKPYPISRQQWKLLKALWPVGQKVAVVTVLKEVYGPKHVKPHALQQLQGRTQTTLDACKLPFRIVRPASLWLRLDARQPVTRRDR